MRKRRNSLILILGGFAFIFVLGISYFFLQKRQLQNKPTSLPDMPGGDLNQPVVVDTSNWQTYTDPQHKYTFMYPSSITPEIIGTHVSINFAPPDPRQIVGLCPPSIGFGNYDRAADYQWYLPTVPTVISGRTAEQSEKTDTYKCVHKIISIPKYPSETSLPELIISMQYRTSDTATANITNQILSTFKFTDQKQINNDTQSLDDKIASCQGIKNGSALTVKETTRMFINLPKDVYPDKDGNLHISQLSGNASAGYISNGGPPGQEYQTTSDCWSYYDEFDGNGVIKITVPSAIKSYPDYSITVTVTKI